MSQTPNPTGDRVPEPRARRGPPRRSSGRGRRSLIGPRALAVGVCAATAAAAGCQTTTIRSVPTTPPPPPAPATNADVRAAAASGGGDPGPFSVNDAVAGDPSAGRLQDISGAMLLYYAVHKRLPPQLDDLKPLADAGTDLPTLAPSGRPYLYAPGGLVAQGTNYRIVVADPAPSPAGVRQCIRLPNTMPAPGAALTTEVVAVPEAAFKQYVPAY